MQAQTILTSDYLDILFRDRNKLYGAYALRKQYQNSAIKSISIILFLTAIIFVLAFRNKDEIATIVAKATTTPVEMTHLPLPETILPPPAPKTQPATVPKDVATVKYDVPKIVVDNTILTNTTPSIKDLNDKMISDANKDGDATKSDLAASTKAQGSGGDGGDAITGGGTSISASIPIYVEQMPEFNGSLTDYMQRNLRYPEQAKDNGIQGRVTVKFVVMEDGSVANAIVIKGIGGGCDEEALRVVNKMPKWKAGKQNGVPVKVYHTLPIVFKLNN